MDKSEKYQLYASLLIEWNKVMNLTAINDYQDIYVRHFEDCKSIAKYIEPNQLVADIGSGAGFPGLVLAIECPDTNFVLIEPLQKRVRFLNEVIKTLGLENVEVINKRAEDVKMFEYFDLAVARAVSSLNILCELMAPLIKVNGKLILMKGPKLESELEMAKNAFVELSLSLDKVDYYSLTGSDILLGNVIINKMKKTKSKYPRLYSQIKKKPL